MMQGFVLATQFLTRLPVPATPDFKPEDLSRAAVWFPAVGLLVGALVMLTLMIGSSSDFTVASVMAILMWVWVTGGLHLDGLGDSVDALGASHRDPARLLEVLKDPRAGNFAVIAISVVLIAKFGLLIIIAARNAWWALPLICAWARFGPLMWTLSLEPIAEGSGERFGWLVNDKHAAGWAIGLFLASLIIAPPVIFAAVAVVLWRLYLKRRIKGYTGDFLGAGIVVVELAGLLSVASFA
jgi:adenosylcobinamide-GDP ribazoletransferase